jgi:hypothetical protein
MIQATSQSGRSFHFSPRRPDLLAVLAFSVIAASASLLVWPAQDVPLIDDWTYAWSVEQLHQWWRLGLLPWSFHYAFAQVLWAWPFVAAAGFSFVTLRLSTLVLGWAASLALFGILRMGGVATPAALVGALAFFLNPAFFFLEHSFMTDVPYLAGVNLALLCYALWVTRARLSWLVLGGCFGMAAFLVRQLGLVVLFVPVAYLVLFRPALLRRVAVVLVAVAPIPIAIAVWWGIRNALGVSWKYAEMNSIVAARLSPAWWLTSAAWDEAFTLVLHLLVSTGLVLAPLTIAALAARRRGILLWIALAAGVAASGLIAVGRLPDPLHPGQVLSATELGLNRSLIRRASDPLPPLSTTMIAVISTASFMSGAVAVGATALAGRNAVGRLLIVSLLGHLGAAAVAVLIHDRYYLPLLPALIFGPVRLISSRTWTVVAGGLVIGGLGAAAITGTIDALRFNEALARERAQLLSRGVRPQDIDAGYVFNGWWLYAHDLVDKDDVPFVTSPRSLPHTLATTPLAGYTIEKVVHVPSFWSRPDRVYVVRRAGEEDRNR